MMDKLFYFPFIAALTKFLLVWLLQVQSQHLIKTIKKDHSLYKKANYPTDTYFMVSYLSSLDYSFILFLFKNKNLPCNIEKEVPEYDFIRKLALLTLFVDGALLFSILGLMIYRIFF